MSIIATFVAIIIFCINKNITIKDLFIGTPYTLIQFSLMSVEPTTTTTTTAASTSSSTTDWLPDALAKFHWVPTCIQLTGDTRYPEALGTYHPFDISADCISFKNNNSNVYVNVFDPSSFEICTTSCNCTEPIIKRSWGVLNELAVGNHGYTVNANLIQKNNRKNIGDFNITSHLELRDLPCDLESPMIDLTGFVECFVLNGYSKLNPSVLGIYQIEEYLGGDCVSYYNEVSDVYYNSRGQLTDYQFEICKDRCNCERALIRGEGGLNWVSSEEATDSNPPSYVPVTDIGFEIPNNCSNVTTTSPTTTTVQGDWPECYHISGEPLHPEMIGRWDLEEYEGDCLAVYKHNGTELYENMYGMGINYYSETCYDACTPCDFPLMISDYTGATELDWMSYDHIDSEDPDSKLIAAWC